MLEGKVREKVMSNTHKDKLRAKLSRKINRCKARRREGNTAYLEAFKKLSPDEQKTIVNYSKAPSRFNRIYNNIPKKRHDKRLCREIAGKQSYDEDFIFSLGKKPKIYHW